MNSFIGSNLNAFYSDFKVKTEVYNVIQDVICDVEVWNSENNLLRANQTLSLSENLNKRLVAKIRQLESKNKAINTELLQIKNKAGEVREHFVSDIVGLLSESKQTKKLQDKLTQIGDINALINENNALKDAAAAAAQDALSHVSHSTGNTHSSDTVESYVTAKAHAIETTSHSSADSLKVETKPSAAAPPPPAPAVAQVVVAPVAPIVAPAVVAPPHLPILYVITDDAICEIFAFLELSDCHEVANSSKFLFYRVDMMFDMAFKSVQPGWERLENIPYVPPSPPVVITHAPTPTASVAPSAVSTPIKSPSVLPTVSSFFGGTASNASSSSSTTQSATHTAAAGHGVTQGGAQGGAQSQEQPRITKEMFIELTKKLAPTELKMIAVMAEQLKKQTGLVESLTTAREDLASKLESTEAVRDFLIDKLKTAETAIKSTMGDNSVLKKQATADREIISYLDMQVQELESDKQDTLNKCNHLQASLDLQAASHSHSEQQLSMELHDIRLNFDSLDNRFKSEKKILVKEVRSLRDTVDKLTQERNLHNNQFLMLRDAFNGTSFVAPQGSDRGSGGGSQQGSGHSSGGGGRR